MWWVDKILMYGGYYICLVLFSFFILGFLINYKNLVALFKGIRAKWWVYLFILFLISLFVRLFFVPQAHYVFYDEYEHINIAKNLFQFQINGMCHFWDGNNCLYFLRSRWPPGYHFILSLFFIPFGPTENIAYLFNALLGSLSVALVFFVAFLVTGKETSAFLSSILLSFLPLHLRFSGNSSTEMAAFIFNLFTVLSFLFFLKARNRKTSLLLVSTLCFSSAIRLENALLSLIIMIICLLLRKGIKLVYWFIGFCVIFFVPIMSAALRCYNKDIDCKPNFNINLVTNLLAWFNNSSVPVLFSIAAVIGNILLFKRNKILFWVLNLYLFLLMAFYAYYSRDLAGLEQRFNMFLLPFFILSVSLALLYFIKFLEAMPKINILITVLLFALNYYLCLPFIYLDLGSFFQRQHPFFYLPKDFVNSYMIAAFNPPAIITTTNHPSMHIDLLFREGVHQGALESKKLLLVKDYWWYRLRMQGDQRITLINDNYQLTPLVEYRLEEGTLGYYIMNKKKDAPLSIK